MIELADSAVKAVLKVTRMWAGFGKVWDVLQFVARMLACGGLDPTYHTRTVFGTHGCTWHSVQEHDQPYGVSCTHGSLV